MRNEAGDGATRIKLKAILRTFKIDRTTGQASFTQGLVESMQVIQVALDIRIIIVMLELAFFEIIRDLPVGQTGRRFHHGGHKT